MAPETAQITFYAIAALMLFVWLLGVRYAFGKLRPPREPEVFEDGAVFSGEQMIEGDAHAISRAAAELVTETGAVTGSVSWKITECTPERVAFERLPGTGRGIPFDSAVLHLRQEGDRVRVRYEMRVDRFMRIMRLVCVLVCFAYGGVFVIGVPIVVWKFALNAENPHHRWQVFQTFQMVHGVWPPFLMGYLTGRLLRTSRSYFEALIANLGKLAHPG